MPLQRMRLLHKVRLQYSGMFFGRETELSESYFRMVTQWVCSDYGALYWGTVGSQVSG